VKRGSTKRTLIGLGILVGALILIGAYIWYRLAYAFPKLDERYYAASVLGAIGSLFAGLAFAGVVYTLVLQKEALEGISQQSFETMLVQLIGFHHEIVGQLQFRRSGTDYIGREVIRQLSEELDLIASVQQPDEESAPNIQAVRRRYQLFYNSRKAQIDHYFRNLYHIIKYIDESDVPNARRYTSLVRAQLSASELQLLFYGGLSEEGTKFKPLIEKYALLEPLPANQPQIVNRRELYQSAAYGV
jgi:hypothetical protein